MALRATAKRRTDEVATPPAPNIEADLELFVGRAAHDLKAPLRQIAAYCDLIARQESERLSPSGREWLSAARRGAARMNRLVDGLMTHAMLAGDGDRRADVDLDRVVDEARAVFVDRLDQAGGVVEISPLGRVRGSEWRLAIIFQNLISNAIAYQRSGVPPKVRVAAERDEGSVTITVSDNGVGIPEDERERVFEPFERGVGVRFSSGIGLGLSNCRKAVEEMGGSIWVEANSPAGSVFHVRLPIDAD